MRAARLLQTLLLLQNRSRLTSAALADILEVSQRTILRDLDAMTEAGLPIIVHRGREGGIELGFDYRTRLTGLDAAEAEAMGLILSLPLDRLAPFGLAEAGARACAKIWEAFPDQTRETMAVSRARFGIHPQEDAAPDPRLAALAGAIRRKQIVRLRAKSSKPQRIHPTRLWLGEEAWTLRDAMTETDISDTDWGDINISSRRFT